jgi:ribosomal protein S27E
VTRAPARDLIIPGSARNVVIHEEYVLVTVECGRCQGRQEVRAESKTTRCTACGRTCRLPRATAPNVIPLRRTA